MAHFAKVVNDKVVRVVVADSDYFDNFTDTSPGRWIQTSYNTKSGVHINDGTPLRKNYAGIGFTYDATKDAFIPPQLFSSWTLNETSCTWEPPTACPDDDKMYTWNEDTTNWVEITVGE